MQIAEADLQYITRMAAAAYTPAQIAFAMGYDQTSFIALMQEENEASAAYFKGLFSSELAVRESAFLLARSGSSPAQTLALKTFDETRKNLRLNGIEEV